MDDTLKVVAERLGLALMMAANDLGNLLKKHMLAMAKEIVRAKRKMKTMKTNLVDPSESRPLTLRREERVILADVRGR